MALALLGPVVCFVVGSVYVERWSEKVHVATLSIVTSAAPSIVYLSTMRNDIRRIGQRALLAQPVSVARDRAAIAAITDDLDGAESAYRRIADYSGELEAYQAMQRQRAPFFTTVERLLDRAEEGVLASEEALQQLRQTADTLADATGALVKLNADQVATAGDTIAALRRRTLWLSDARDTVAFLFVVAGTVLGIRGARQQGRGGR